MLISALLSLFSGAALVITILLRASLGLVLTALVALVAMAAGIIWSSSSAKERRLLQTKCVVGATAGILGTIAYDASRWLLVKTIGWTFNPFGAFPVFGRLLIGVGHSSIVILAVGIGYHALNGILFAIAYSLVAFARPWYWGILWALTLESAMFTLYPGWLDLTAVMKEFTVISLSGHVLYGSVVGILCQWIPRRLK
jgi:hypothetical protein